MRIYNLLIMMLTVMSALVFQSCEKDEAPTLSVTQERFEDVDPDGVTLNVSILTNQSWSVSSSEDWCEVFPTEGRGNCRLTLTVGPNPSDHERRATITVGATTSSHRATVEIVQSAGASSIEEYRYSLPVIFHVLYKSADDRLQYVDADRLSDILDEVNRKYRDNYRGVDMGITFTLATADKSGNRLSTPGVEYVRWEEVYPIDCMTFMNDESGRYVKYLWDPNKYINVMVYNFAEDSDSQSIILGVSHLPLSYSGTYLDGLSEVEYEHLTLDNLSFPYCVSINSLYAYDQSTATEYNTADVTVTLAHELGHYLGLHHAFSETGDVYGCEDTDYCADTPTYDKAEYDDYCMYLLANDPEKFTFDNLVKRSNCSGDRFVSRNIMDYAFSYSDEFTPDQRARTRHVLMYSPLIPGPKATSGGKSRAVAPAGQVKLPVRVVR
ncbi:MAG: zinc-dependent metalloproteinase lipoprotein [Pseudoflavonifractor sp.]|nr:zinc-dependent metalloproteinase lipoprotein [Pseudoflavonifractor sp.]